jgi:hypothetical protein
MTDRPGGPDRRARTDGGDRQGHGHATGDGDRDGEGHRDPDRRTAAPGGTDPDGPDESSARGATGTDRSSAPRSSRSPPEPGVAGAEFGDDEDDPVGLTRHLLATAAYATVVVVVAGLGTTAVGYATGRGLVGAKWGLFVVATLLLGYGSLRLRSAIAPAERGRRGDDRPGVDLDLEGLPVVGRLVAASRSGSGDGADAPGLVGVADRLLPASLRVPPDEAWPVGLKQLVAAVCLFAVSFALETVFGVVA